MEIRCEIPPSNTGSGGRLWKTVLVRSSRVRVWFWTRWRRVRELSDACHCSVWVSKSAWMRKSKYNVDKQIKSHLEDACVETLREKDSCRPCDAKDYRVVVSLFACGQRFAAAVAMYVRREGGSVVNVVNKEK